MRRGHRGFRISGLLFAVLLICHGQRAGGLQPTFGGSLTWKIDSNFNSGVRRVWLSLTTASVPSQNCSYAVGATPLCTGESRSCNATCTLARHHGVLCITQLVPSLHEDGTLQSRHWVRRQSCVTTLNNHGTVETLGKGWSVDPAMVGGANKFTVTHLYDRNDSTSEFRRLGGASVVVGHLNHVVTVAPEASALVVWLSADTSAEMRPLLLGQCNKQAAAARAPCAINLDKLGDNPWMGLKSDPYWGAWTDKVKSAVTTQTRGAGAGLEAFIPVCTLSNSHWAGCTVRPVRNFHSPVAILPPLMEVAVTSWTRTSSQVPVSSARFRGNTSDGVEDSFFAPHPPFYFKAYDRDHDAVIQYNPLSINDRSRPGMKKQALDAECFLDGVLDRPEEAGNEMSGTHMRIWPQTQCVGGDHDAAPCNSSSQCTRFGACKPVWSRCRRYKDLDPNPHRRQVLPMDPLCFILTSMS
jgi:hypothetical protein